MEQDLDLPYLYDLRSHKHICNVRYPDTAKNHKIKIVIKQVSDNDSDKS